MVLLVLYGLSSWERRIRRDLYRTLVVDTSASGSELATIRQILADHEAELRDFAIKPLDGGGHAMVEFSVKILASQEEEKIVSDILKLTGTHGVRWT